MKVSLFLSQSKLWLLNLFLLLLLAGTHLGTLLSGFYAVYQIGMRLVENERQEARRAAYYQRYSGQRGQPQQSQRERQLQVRRALLFDFPTFPRKIQIVM